MTHYLKKIENAAIFKEHKNPLRWYQDLSVILC